MNALELLVYLTERQIDSLFRAARSLPPEKLDWKPAPGARSALDQLQEVATALDNFWPALIERKIEWDASKMEKWMKERAKLTSLDELEQRTRENTAKLVDLIRSTPESELSAPVDLPFPGEFTLGGVFAYHYWNASYHEGQITYIGSLLG